MEKYDTWDIFDKVSQHRKIRRILLYGVPGTGKTTKACESANEDGFYSITVTEESSIAEILGMWIPKGKKFKWYDGLAVRAWKENKLLVINEIDKASGSVLTILNAILDDKKIARLDLPNSETIYPGKNFKVIATMNGKVTELPESLADRFDLKLNITKPCNEAIETLPEDLRPLVDMAYSKSTLSITFREIVAFSKLRNIIGEKAYIVFGDVGNDVRTAMKLGEREKEEKVRKDFSSKEIELKSIESLSPSDIRAIINNYISYWDSTEYEDLDLDIMQGYVKKLSLPESVLDDIERAFLNQKVRLWAFKKEINVINEKIMEEKKKRAVPKIPEIIDSLRETLRTSRTTPPF